MKLVRNFAQTCYSEVLIMESSAATENEREDGSLITENKNGVAMDPEIAYHGGLGLKSGFQETQRSRC